MTRLAGLLWWFVVVIVAVPIVERNALLGLAGASIGGIVLGIVILRGKSV